MYSSYARAMSESLRRVLADLGIPDLVDQLAAIPGSDFTSLWLAIARARAEGLTHRDILRRYESDALFRPAFATSEGLRRATQKVLEVLPADFELVTLAPVVPAGTHWVLGEISPNNVLTTVRGAELAADNAAGLALEAASRRRGSRNGTLKLASTQRLTRAQPFSGPLTHAHFEVLALVTAGRDRGHHLFEIESAVDHLSVYAGFLAGVANNVVVSLTDYEGHFGDVLAAIEENLPDGVTSRRWPDRADGRAYYAGLRFSITARKAGVEYNLVDGGLVDWTQHLLSDRKERMLTSGIGLDRLAVLFGS